MGDCQYGDLQVGFDGRLKLKFLGSQVTTDAGLLAYRELDETLVLTEAGKALLQDNRLGQKKQHGLLPPLRHRSLTTLREKLVKIGAKVTRHSKYVTFQLTEVAVTRNLFSAILNRIARLATHAAKATCRSMIPAIETKETEPWAKK